MPAKKVSKRKPRRKSARDYPAGLLLRIFNAHPLDKTVGLTEHSIERYRERFRPGYHFAQARADLSKRMVREGSFVVEPPKWLGYGTDDKQAIGYVAIADELALPVVERPKQTPRFVASTCLYGYLP